MIYLDAAAATPVSEKALRAMLPFFSENFFNPSAPYLPAKRVREAYEAAKAEIAHSIGAKAADLVITAGATESINLAFTAVKSIAAETSAAKAATENLAAKTTTVKTAVAKSTAATGKVLTLPTEHAAVLAAARQFPCAFIKVDKNGLIDLKDLRAKLTDDVVFVSVSLANNELGTIQPLADIAEILRAARSDRLRRGLATPLYFHSDASQALNLLDLSVSRLGVDLLTLNAAKCGGPKGVGALYLAHGVPVRPLSLGGGQERGLRSGTENVPGVLGFAAALSEAKSHLASNRHKYLEMSTLLRRELSADPRVVFLGDPRRQLANFLPISFPGLDAERLVYKLEAEGVLVSTGAACAANKGTKSHVLAAIGLSDAEIAGSLRLSLGPTNTLAEMKPAAEKILRAARAEYDRETRR